MKRVKADLTKQELKMAPKLHDSKTLEKLESQLCPKCHEKLEAIRKKKP